jgi:hypothetical protein
MILVMSLLAWVTKVRVSFLLAGSARVPGFSEVSYVTVTVLRYLGLPGKVMCHPPESIEVIMLLLGLSTRSLIG